MIDSGRIATDKELERMERKLAQIYERASKELSEKADKYFERFKALDEKKQALLKAGKITEKEYQTWRQNKIMTGGHWVKMREQAAEKLHQTNVIANEYVNGRLAKIYAINYNYTAGVIEAGTKRAISFELASEGAIKYLIENVDKNLLPKKILDPLKDIPWNMRKINSEILQGIIQGESIPKMAKRLRNVGVTNKKSAVRAARTIVTQTENKARYDCAEAAKEKGVIMKKEWIATNDNRTRDEHLDAWDKYGTREDAIDIDEPFIVGGEEMMYAGDPSGGPQNVYNCRCSTPHIPVGFTSILPPEKRGHIKVTFT